MKALRSRWGAGLVNVNTAFTFQILDAKKKKKKSYWGGSGGEAVFFLSSQQAFGSHFLLPVLTSLPPVSIYFPSILRMKNPLSKAGFGP